LEEGGGEGEGRGGEIVGAHMQLAKPKRLLTVYLTHTDRGIGKDRR
jgi:hypothetical protein